MESNIRNDEEIRAEMRSIKTKFLEERSEKYFLKSDETAIEKSIKELKKFSESLNAENYMHRKTDFCDDVVVFDFKFDDIKYNLSVCANRKQNRFSFFLTQGDEISPEIITTAQMKHFVERMSKDCFVIENRVVTASTQIMYNSPINRGLLEAIIKYMMGENDAVNYYLTDYIHFLNKEGEENKN